MKTRKVNRYYCEHCGKGGQSASCMSVHEKHCGMNPNRECRLCKNRFQIEEARKILGPPLDKDELKEIAAGVIIGRVPQQSIEDLGKLEDLYDGCPNCILAAFKQTGHHGALEFGWIYSEALAEWWEFRNEERLEEYE